MPCQARRDKRHCCTVCSQRFTSPRDVRVHINRLHLHVNTFKCLLCRKEGPDPSAIRRHCQKVHNIPRANITVHYEEFNKSNQWKTYYQRIHVDTRVVDLPCVQHPAGQADTLATLHVSANSNIQSPMPTFSQGAPNNVSVPSAITYTMPHQAHTDIYSSSRLLEQSRSDYTRPSGEEIFQSFYSHHWPPLERPWRYMEVQVHSASYAGVNLGIPSFNALPDMAAVNPFHQLFTEEQA